MKWFWDHYLSGASERGHAHVSALRATDLSGSPPALVITKPEDPGALKVFDYKNGVLTNEVSIAPNGGKEFGPRHLDFHPTKPWMYVSIETQNKMYMFRMEDGRINPEIAYRAETLAEPNNMEAGSRHGPRPSERPFCVRGKSCRGDDRVSGQASFQGW
jgi:6-phosphogluconolactonase (cycloisomerase 2 family)